MFQTGSMKAAAAPRAPMIPAAANTTGSHLPPIWPAATMPATSAATPSAVTASSGPMPGAMRVGTASTQKYSGPGL